MLNYFKNNILKCIFVLFSIIVAFMLYFLISGLRNYYESGDDKSYTSNDMKSSLEEDIKMNSKNVFDNIAMDEKQSSQNLENSLSNEYNTDSNNDDTNTNNLETDNSSDTSEDRRVTNSNFSYTAQGGNYYEDYSSGYSDTSVVLTDMGFAYSNMGTIRISKIGVDLPIASKTTDELMNTSACRLWGPHRVNEIGNLCIVGHNWRNTKLFSKVPELEIGDTFEIIDLNGNSMTYRIYNKYTVNPNDVSCLDEETHGERIVTLITCTDDSTRRFVLPAKAI